MLRICTEQEYRKYADFVYELALDQSKSGYPTYSDGMVQKLARKHLQCREKKYPKCCMNFLFFFLALLQRG